MSTPITTSPSPSRIVVTPDSPLGPLDKSALGRTQRTYSTEKSFRPANQHPNALLEGTNEKISYAVQKQLGKGSVDLQESIARLAALRLGKGKEAILFSPRPIQPSCRILGKEATTSDSRPASKIKKD